MKRLLVNGSPRGQESNSRLLLKWLTLGIESQGLAAPPIIDLADTRKLAAHRQDFLEAEEVILAFPLYTDSLPGLVKNFLDSLVGADRSTLSGKRVGFVIQSGFPESIHSEALAAWLARVCVRLGFINIGIVVKGGVEGIRVIPESMSKKLRANLLDLGVSLVKNGRLDPEIIAQMATPRRLGTGKLFLFTVLKPTGLLNFYWNSQLKKFGAWQRRFDRPFA